jgi:hypothetical protein
MLEIGAHFTKIKKTSSFDCLFYFFVLELVVIRKRLQIPAQL